MAQKWIYQFGNGQADGDASLKNLLGGKGANLAEMSALGLPVPSGFTMTTELCTHYYKNNETYPETLKDDVHQAVKAIEAEMGGEFGNPEHPLLLSVRSGARVSMPGMMDTVLNLGLNDVTVEGLAKQSQDARFAWDSYRRFIQMYADVVMGMSHHDFEEILAEHKNRLGLEDDTEITSIQWKEIVAEYKELVEQELGRSFPDDVQEQLWGAIGAVFGSWKTPRAVTYRRLHSIPENWGTAVNIQSMVFGNMGNDCATGVAFTRDPSTGDNYFYGEYLVNAQGEDVVAGVRTPQSLTIKGREKEGSNLLSMEETLPEVFAQLSDIRLKLETHYKDIQDIEFTVQQNKLYMLQTRTGKRTAAAAIKIAVDMVDEGMLSREEALLRVDANALDQLLHPTLDPDASRDVLGKGLPASPGAASGKLVFTADDAEAWAKNEENVILARTETSPEDIHGMHAAKGILTSRGGMTSHAAVVARGMGRACVAGAGSLYIDSKNKTLTTQGQIFKEGDIVTIDGTTGEIMKGAVPTLQPKLSGDFTTLMAWADEIRRMKVRTNAETLLDAENALKFGAEGIGLCRTEHMFFDPDRIQKVREMIFAENKGGRDKALTHLLPEQRSDFEKLFTIMQGLPVTVRLLDPPLHEFLPHDESDIQNFAQLSGLEESLVQRRLKELSESNPMLGHRGCRLGLTYPEIYAMQARAILEAAVSVQNKTNKPLTPEIMIPLIVSQKELSILKNIIDATADDVFEETGVSVDYLVGTMIEIPRAALMADEIAKDAEFFSFGTNDLTQTTLGMSRDDATTFLPSYVEKGVFRIDPFVSLDQEGVGQLLEIATERGLKTRPDLKLGICGEHGGDPASIDFCERIGLNYVSCSPFRVPIARLAAAQATIRMKKNATKRSVHAQAA